MEDNQLILLAINTIAVIFGVILGGGGVLAVLNRLGGNVQALDGLERIILGTVPASLVAQINQGASALGTAANIVETVTDGEPNE